MPSLNLPAHARRILPALLGVGITTTTALADPHTAPPPVLATHWQGAYAYASNAAPVPFTMVLSASNGVVSGRVTEPALYPGHTVPQLFANISGTLQGTTLAFTKTYDGTGGQTQSVQYVGDVSLDGHSMTGRWTMPNLSGTFSATATDLNFTRVP